MVGPEENSFPLAWRRGVNRCIALKCWWQSLTEKLKNWTIVSAAA